MGFVTHGTDVHQHLWSAPLVEALAARSELPFVHVDRGMHVLHLAGEAPYLIDVAAEHPRRRAALAERDGLERALLCLSSPLGVEWLPDTEARTVLDAYHDGALAAGGPFGVWGALPLAVPDPADVDRVLARGCVGVSLPAGALARPAALRRVRPLLARAELLGSPVLVHPGPGPRRLTAGAGAPETPLCDPLCDPLWWPALTGYVAGMQAAWLTFATAGRAEHPSLRVIFTMLAGLAPLQAERLAARGGPEVSLRDELVFYDTASYGSGAIRSLAGVVGAQQIVYGSDRPVVDPGALGLPGALDSELVEDAARRALDCDAGAGAPLAATAGVTS